MSDDQKNPPAQPEFGELAPEGWSWNPEANAPHTPETLKAAEVAAKAAAKAKSTATATALKEADRQSSRLKGRQTPLQVAPPVKKQSTPPPEKLAAASDESLPESESAPPAPTEAEKKTRALAMARLASDRFITWGLLGVAIFSVISGLGDYLNLSSTLNGTFDQLNTMEPGLNLQPYSNFGLAKALGWGIVMAQAVVIGLTFWWAVRRMKTGKLAFWVPVVGFAISSVVVFAFMLFAFVGDPTAWNTIVSFFQHAGAVTPTSTSTGTAT